VNDSSEEADKVFEVANAIPVNRSTKAIPINISWFLFIFSSKSDIYILSPTFIFYII